MISNQLSETNIKDSQLRYSVKVIVLIYHMVYDQP